MFTIATLIYLAGGIFALRELMAPRPSRSPCPLLCALGGFLLHTLWLAWVTAERGRLPEADPFTSLSLIAWCAVLLFLISYRLFGAPPALTSFFMPVVVLFSLAALGISVAEPAAEPGSASGWMLAHGILMLLGCAAFAFAFVTGVMYLVQEHQLKAKSFGKLLRRLPSLDVLDRMNVSALAFGFAVYTGSLVAAAVGQMRSPLQWVRQPLGFLVAVTWVLYLFAVHARFLTPLRGKKLAYLTVLGFALILCTLGLFLGADSLHARGTGLGGLAP
ncbi:MAG: cytochrome c biogenesis protein CcsA [Planctomycetes bacterium]|nr:cytochrome c biogenesis protein CcsA [Planctomycetota bacterium]